MKISYDKETDALNIVFKEGRVSKTLEMAPEVILDVDIKNRPLYLEIIGLKEKFGKKVTDKISVKNFNFINSKKVIA
ncbi:MAG: hypothetical protein UT65_C0008G0014 [Parcubacteria group bacterium GW2011_GWF2_39_8b]|uniref:DUF2283 domain-containing protein n=3 Tax=Candidatus Zambryskiibacteriota TaxID=1817925 RepID=A0A1G2TAS7_9BACT|nr:MAG: hypothetical protein UT65_C0008G0014 [Parcubacteria group bacterium GW2011_GWF2_39_8b]KKR45729.1 MAG: hypothetical protein UT81_C0007G0011 [Parcubacteria group bacterium GW2011_GWA2_40_14]OHA93721.1 MAG: hypothetical protein A2W58_00695 [Candidatus Zambryskibacteria bacterium RIFCSPHIGHO2_02_38_10.5]OHA95729.1 MAG: hypothetical protein A3C63_00630 [Candidatus Zambryskibacteria bacterium RIFCSPHIGHO2_02_FULL_39_82]OHA97844.1 MAG: hypothetical protein A3E32_02600 [Candidatus Zambryskibact